MYFGSEKYIFYDDNVTWGLFPKDAKISFYDDLDTTCVIYRKRLAKSLE